MDEGFYEIYLKHWKLKAQGSILVLHQHTVNYLKLNGHGFFYQLLRKPEVIGLKYSAK
jgi:hypothetical protein